MRGSAAFRLSPTPGGVIGPIARDPDARDYIRRVAAADGQPLEPLVQRAIDAFVRGCKADGTWNAIKASCILAGARTLSGALVPLVGTAPTNFNFVAGDYNRETGLVGDGSTKYLDSNRNNNADPQDSQHMSVYATTAGSPATAMYIGAGGSTGVAGATHFNLTSTGITHRNRSNSQNTVSGAQTATGLLSMNRSNASGFNYRHGGSTGTFARVSQIPFNGNIHVYANEAAIFNNCRLAFYSIGESLDLALLDARVTTLITAIGAAL